VLDAFFEHFTLAFFTSPTVNALMLTLTDIFLLFADLYILCNDISQIDAKIKEYLHEYLKMLSTVMEEEEYVVLLAGNQDIGKKVEQLASKDSSLVSTQSQIVLLM
jgi:Icc-related predicted phosphoesterase